jgi:DNA-binding transcriptional MocR family regulator
LGVSSSVVAGVVQGACVKLAGATVSLTVSADKLNMLRHANYFKDLNGIKEHMRKHAAIVRPKFEAVINTLERELGDLGIGTWTKPKGGYFISFESLPNCAKAIIALCKEAGVVLTGAGAAFPYGKDPNDSNIRIAPTFPSEADLQQATDLFVLCVKLASARKIVEAM